MASQTKRKKRYTAEDIAALIEEYDEATEIDVFIQPPENNENSDCDSGDEDDGTLNNLPGSLLRAACSSRIKLYTGENVIIGESDEDDSCSDDDGSQNEPPIEESRQDFYPPKPPQLKSRKWKKTNLKKNEDIKDWQSSTSPKLDGMTPVALFNLFFDDDVMNYIVYHTNLYAQQVKNKTSFETTVNEIKKFFAILLISGYCKVPRMHLYWENKPDVNNEAISTAMSRTRFQEILQCIHFADNSDLPKNDSFAKVRSFMSLINERCLLYFPTEQNLSIDESMIPYFGQNSCKQRMPGKPVRVGYKSWVVATPLGYVIQFEPYQGAKSRGPVLKSKETWGLSESVVLDLAADLPTLPFHLYFDNYFTSFRLLEQMSSFGYGATGTMRQNRLHDCPIDTKKMDKQIRGSYDQVIDSEGKIAVVCWKDTKSVLIASNTKDSHPLSQTSRWDRKTKQRVTVTQPEIVKSYNKNMGGVDRTDQNVAQYRVKIRNKKWYWPLFAWTVDMVVQNAWILHRLIADPDGKRMSLLDFRREIAACLLLSEPISEKKKSRASFFSSKVPESIRFDGMNHIDGTSERQLRCTICKKNTKKTCQKCSVALHKKICFDKFHENC